MNGKPLSSELARSSPAASQLLSFVNRRRLKKWFWRLGFFLVVSIAVLVEFQTSLLQSWIFTSTNERVYYTLADGPSREIAFPRSAPFDDRRGYSKLPLFQSRLESLGYKVVRQARQSETMRMLFENGVSPPYNERPDAGLDIRGADGTSLFRYGQSEFLFAKIADIPPLLVNTLLFLENRDLNRPAAPWQNPVIEWDRMLKAAVLYVGAKLNLPVPVQGGSTLAVQLEKFRHSPNGRTDTPLEKLRQIIGASLKAYREGPNTRAWRERIIVDYLNTVPLAAAPGYGEIHGLGEGLYAWFGVPLAEAVAALRTPGQSPDKLRAFKQALTLLISVRAPSVFLIDERASLEDKVNRFTRLLARAGVIDWEMAAALQETPIRFLPSAPLPPQPSSSRNKAANAIRTHMMEALNVPNIYDLNRFHLQVESTFDVALQKQVTEFLSRLADPEVVAAYGLNGERLLEGADPSKVIYSFLLVEATPAGNLVRVQADNFAAPFDFNKSVKLELGSTAKLRTLTHYLEVMAELHRELSGLDDRQLGAKAQSARDPLTRWAVETLRSDKSMALQAFLDRAMERKYSASPFEEFFTGGGVHHFENFDKDDNHRILEVREAFRNSTNLVFIRLMRDLVSYHRARLPFDAEAVMSDPAHPTRVKMLQEIAEEESRAALRRAYQNYTQRPADEIVRRVVGTKGSAERRLAILFFAWRVGDGEGDLKAWLEKHGADTRDVAKLYRAFRNPRLTLADYAYLLSLHPLDLWCAGEYYKDPRLSWEALYQRSGEARRMGSAWLLAGHNRRAQDLRLRIRLEKEAFARMTPYWQRLGFPFKTLVPTYATAIGSSSDRPVALAELVGILVNDGVRRPAVSLTQVHFAADTPYETLMEKSPDQGERVLAPEIARTVRKAMAEVVEQGTARRLSGVFKLSDGKALAVGGKTGSGDNRFETFNRAGAVTSSRATNRTATFVFYIGERYFGVVTAYVEGREAENYHFTSALPVTLMKLLAPTLLAKWDKHFKAPPAVPLASDATAERHGVSNATSAIAADDAAARRFR
ncbi:MAG TPA: transglycosylase domain-containing protein [Candidatus Binatia bacterium]|nr:transglycosylase domain-containing protein [Candidatus Binatia bacterium]